MEELRAKIRERVRIDPSSKCWVWQGPVRATYGSIYWKGKTRYVHRMAYEAFVGSIPEGMWVCHHCDNRVCCNPAHLFLGTRQDNVDDMMRKGRHVARCGSANGFSKLTEADVAAILRAEGTQSEIARRFGVTQALVSLIRKRTIWRHVSPEA